MQDAEFFQSMRIVRQLSPTLSAREFNEDLFLIEEETWVCLGEARGRPPKDVVAWTIRRLHTYLRRQQSAVRKAKDQMEKASRFTDLCLRHLEHIETQLLKGDTTAAPH